VVQATECQASSAQRRRLLTLPWGRQRLGPGLRVEPETIDLKPIGFLNPARRPIAQTGQQGLSLITKMQFVAAGPIWSRVSTNQTDETKREKAYISTKPSRMSTRSERALGFESSACDPTRCAREAGIHKGPRTFLRLPKTVQSLFYGKITDWKSEIEKCLCYEQQLKSAAK
jgi:hypothetical protein